MLIDVALNVFAIFEPANPSLEFDNFSDTRTLHDNTIASKDNNCNLAIKKNMGTRFFRYRHIKLKFKVFLRESRQCFQDNFVYQ